MIVHVKMFARARDLAGVSEVSVTLPDGATVADLRRVLGREYPALSGLLARSALAVADEFATDADPLSEGVEVALLPPVSGGAFLAACGVARCPLRRKRQECGIDQVERSDIPI